MMDAGIYPYTWRIAGICLDKLFLALPCTDVLKLTSLYCVTWTPLQPLLLVY